jgi:hypothetical protein
MKMVGCDLHAKPQTIAMVDTDTVSRPPFQPHCTVSVVGVECTREPVAYVPVTVM